MLRFLASYFTPKAILNSLTFFTSDLFAKLTFEVPMISHLRRCFAVGCLLALLSSLAFAQEATIKPNDALLLEIC